MGTRDVGLETEVNQHRKRKEADNNVTRAVAAIRGRLDLQDVETRDVGLKTQGNQHRKRMEADNNVTRAVAAMCRGAALTNKMWELVTSDSTVKQKAQREE